MTPTYRIPVEESYASALGHAIYGFAYLEWGIVYLTDRFWNGYVSAGGTKSSDAISADFNHALTNSTITVDQSTKDRLAALAAKFVDLVKQRDDLVHDTPGTAPGGQQQLISRAGSSLYKWDEAGIISFALQCETAAIEANDLYNNHVPSKAASV